jgi:hypothetical protein
MVINSGKPVEIKHKNYPVPTSASAKVSRDFATTLLEIVMPKGSRALFPAGKHLGGRGEKEIILERGSTLRAISATREREREYSRRVSNFRIKEFLVIRAMYVGGNLSGKAKLGKAAGTTSKKGKLKERYTGGYESITIDGEELLKVSLASLIKSVQQQTKGEADE